MAKIWALIENDVVVNTIVWDGVTPWSPPAGQQCIEISDLNPVPAIGWTYQNGQFFPPAGP